MAVTRSDDILGEQFNSGLIGVIWKYNGIFSSFNPNFSSTIKKTSCLVFYEKKIITELNSYDTA